MIFLKRAQRDELSLCAALRAAPSGVQKSVGGTSRLVPRTDAYSGRRRQAGTMSNRSTRIIRPFLAVAAVTLMVTSLSACSLVNQTIGDAWSVTYRVVVDQPGDAEITHVTIGGAEKRGESPKVADMGSQTAVASADGKTAVWEDERVVLATEEALISATAPSGATATCSVLLDGTREIAKATSAPGEPVTCRVTTPSFS